MNEYKYAFFLKYKIDFRDIIDDYFPTNCFKLRTNFFFFPFYLQDRQVAGMTKNI